jgi:hypothetical protein
MFCIQIIETFMAMLDTDYVFPSSSVVSHASFLLLMGSTIFLLLVVFSTLVVAQHWKTVPWWFFLLYFHGLVVFSGFFCASVAGWFSLQCFGGFFYY